MKKKLEKIKAERQTIRKIDLSETYDLLEVPEIIDQCPELEKLDLSFCGITQIPDFVFKLPKLRELNYLRCNKLQKTPDSFSHLQNIEKLSIYINVKKPSLDGIHRLTALKTLILQGNIEHLPQSVYEIPNLEHLELFDTRIPTLSADVRKLTKLKKVSIWQPLFLSDDKPVPLHLNEIFEHLSQCKSLKALHLNKNGIQVIPPTISLLQQLQILSAQDNRIVNFPESIYALKNLKALDLGVNQLKEIPKGIGQLTRLKELKLNSNWKNEMDATNLFVEIDQLKELETIELWSCQSVREIPETIASLKKLKKLDVDNNRLVSLPKSLCKMTHLKYLRVFTNKIPAEQIDELKRCLTGTKVFG